MGLQRPFSPVHHRMRLHNLPTLAHAWHCPLQEYPPAGHDLPLDAPQWVVEQVCDWLHPNQTPARCA